MLAKRILPCLDVKAGRVVKGVNFVDLKDAGDPVELAQVYNLAREAMGFNQARGDTLNVVNAPFDIADVEEVAGLPAWKDPALQSLAKEIIKYLLIGGLLVYLVLGVLRPMIGELAAIGASSAVVESAAATQAMEAAEGGDVVTLGVRKPHSYEEDLTMVKDLAKQDPKIMANVVKDWVNKE